VNAREEVLARLRTARDAGAPSAPVVVPRDYHVSGRYGAGTEDAVARLDETLTDYRATVTRVGAEAHVAAAVATFLGSGTSVVVPPDVPDAWLAAFDGRVRRDEPACSVDELDHLDAVLTGAAVAIADTGTFVLDSGAPDQGRRVVTLVPDHHVCVIRAADVVSSVPEALARLDPTRPLTFVSGPSATSDIELDRVEGVHGPRRLDVVLVGP
jgi:L-lactate dehydrogenase complex protein LldG